MGIDVSSKNLEKITSTVRLADIKTTSPRSARSAGIRMCRCWSP
jgi:hypothetical protein